MFIKYNRVRPEWLAFGVAVSGAVERSRACSLSGLSARSALTVTAIVLIMVSASYNIVHIYLEESLWLKYNFESRQGPSDIFMQRKRFGEFHHNVPSIPSFSESSLQTLALTILLLFKE